MQLDDLQKQRKFIENDISKHEEQRTEIAKALTANEKEKAKLEKDFMMYLQEFNAIDKNKKTITNDEFFRKFNISVKHE